MGGNARNCHGFLLYRERRVIWGENIHRFLGSGNDLGLENKRIRLVEIRQSGVEICGKSYGRRWRIWRFLYPKSMPTTSHFHCRGTAYLSTQNDLANDFSQLCHQPPPQNWCNGHMNKVVTVAEIESTNWPHCMDSHLYQGWSSSCHIWMSNFPAKDTKWMLVNNSVTLGMLCSKRFRNSLPQG